MLLLTIAVIAVLFIISYLIFDKDLLAPPTAVGLVFLFGGFCCLYNEKRWALDFSWKSLALISAGIIATMIGGIIGVFLASPRKGTYSFLYKKNVPESIRISPIKTVAIIAFQLLAIFLLFQHIRNLTGFSNWMLAVARYRLMTGRLADVEDLSIRMPILTRNIVQFSKMIGIVYSYIIGNNLVASKKKLSLSWIPVLLYSITTFMQGDRSNMIRMWVVVLIVAYTVHRRSVGWTKSRETGRIIRRMAVSIVTLGIIFVAVRELVGRTTDKDPFQYVTFYAGAPMAVLNEVWEHPIIRPEIFGERIFYYLNQSLTAITGWPGRYNFYYDFKTSPNGTVIGNAPTAFRPAYTEFGALGFFFIMIAFGVFFTYLYCKCRDKRGNSKIDFRLMMYAYIAYVFLMYFYSTFFDFLSHVYIKYMIELLLIRWFLVGWDFKRSDRFAFTGGRLNTQPVNR